MFKVYISGPMTGIPYNIVYDRFKKRSVDLKVMGYSVINPFDSEYLNSEVDVSELASLNDAVINEHSIFFKDKWMVSQCDILFADLSYSDTQISIGTIMEIAMANVLNKLIILILPKDNIHNHGFVHSASTYIFEDIESSMKFMKTLLK